MKIEEFLLRTYATYIRRQLPSCVDKLASVLYSRMVLIPKINRFYKDKLNDEQADLINYLRRHGGVLFPFTDEYLYENLKVPVFRCKETKLLYVEIDNKRLYLKKMQKRVARKYFRSIASEMDIRSPHRYVTSENRMIGALENSEKINQSVGHCVEHGDVVIDIGAAEGNFSISVAEEAERIYLFEASGEWVNALKRTFLPYKDKTVITQCRVSDFSDDKTMRIDDFFKLGTITPALQMDSKLFIKIDVEGHEMCVLHGMEALLRTFKNIKVSIAVYHNPEDASEVEKYFNEVWGECMFEYTNGYAMFPDKAPYFRKAVLRIRR